MKRVRIGSKSLWEIHILGLTFLQSYETIVAVKIGDKYKRTNKRYSVTTSKHLNQWCDEPCELIDQQALTDLYYETLVNESRQVNQWNA